MITKKIERVLVKIRELPAEEQNALADWILEELEDDLRWQEKFSQSQTILAKMADQALKDRVCGKTQPLDLSAL
jgi:hypothetical protein